MIAKLVSFALQQRFLIVIASLALMLWGAVSFQKLPIDAYPDLSPTHVEIITQWPGHAAEEIERLVTIPIEIEMNGIPKLDSLRSISLYGLSSVQMNFEYGAEILPPFQFRSGDRIRNSLRLLHHFGRKLVGQVMLADDDLDIDAEVVRMPKNLDDQIGRASCRERKCRSRWSPYH